MRYIGSILIVSLISTEGYSSLVTLDQTMYEKHRPLGQILINKVFILVYSNLIAFHYYCGERNFWNYEKVKINLK